MVQKYFESKVIQMSLLSVPLVVGLMFLISFSLSPASVLLMIFLLILFLFSTIKYLNEPLLEIKDNKIIYKKSYWKYNWKKEEIPISHIHYLGVKQMDEKPEALIIRYKQNMQDNDISVWRKRVENFDDLANTIKSIAEKQSIVIHLLK